MGSDLSVHIDFPAECNRAFVCASLGLFLIAFIDGLVSLVRERLGVVPRDDMEVDSRISGTEKDTVIGDEQRRNWNCNWRTSILRVNSHLAFERRNHLELGADGDYARDLEAQPERGNTCPQSVAARILGGAGMIQRTELTKQRLLPVREPQLGPSINR